MLQCVVVLYAQLQTNPHKCVAVCYSVLQRMAVCCSALQCVAVCGICKQYPQIIRELLEMLNHECVAVRCNVLQCVAVCCRCCTYKQYRQRVV